MKGGHSCRHHSWYGPSSCLFMEACPVQREGSVWPCGYASLVLGLETSLIAAREMQTAILWDGLAVEKKDGICYEMKELSTCVLLVLEKACLKYGLHPRKERLLSGTFSWESTKLLPCFQEFLELFSDIY